MCSAQKRETNHWFIAYEESGELRVSDWTSRYLLCPGTKHLCGESCLRKLLSEFLASAVQIQRTPHMVVSRVPQPAVNSVYPGFPTESRAS